MKTINVNAFETTDGKVFLEKYDAERHEFSLGFKAWYNKNKLDKGSEIDSSYVSSHSVKFWLNENRKNITDYLHSTDENDLNGQMQFLSDLAIENIKNDNKDYAIGCIKDILILLNLKSTVNQIETVLDRYIV